MAGGGRDGSGLFRSELGGGGRRRPMHCCLCRARSWRRLERLVEWARLVEVRLRPGNRGEGAPRVERSLGSIFDSKGDREMSRLIVGGA